MTIQHNLAAMNTARQYQIVTSNRKKNTERLSSGYKINRAADDAANLSISEKMRSQIRGLKQASDNAKDGISLLQIADGALDESQQMIHRIKELSVKAANGTNTDADRQAIQDEIEQLVSEIDRIAEAAEFNTLKMIDGSYSSAGASPAIAAGQAGRGRAAGTAVLDDRSVLAGGDVVMNPVVSGGGISSSQEAALNTLLQDSIVPHAVNSIMNAFPGLGSAASNGQISNEIGLRLYKDSSATLAYVAIRYRYDQNRNILNNSIELNLSVNVGSLRFDNSGNLTADSRTALETTIVHEMIHAFMDDYLTDGMVGAVNGKLDKSSKFPKWFSEGMAQSAAGGCANSNDWVNGALGLNASSTLDQISARVRSSGNKLSSGSTASQYGTGYLASMYLGYLAAGSPSTITAGGLANGLDSVMAKLAAGKTLSDVINEVSGGTYSSLSDFEKKFGDNASSRFISELLNAVGNTGNGGVITSLTDSDLLADSNVTSTVYQVDVDHAFVNSSVGGGRNWGTGGSGRTGTGYGTPSISLGPLNLQIGAASPHSMDITIQDAHAVTLGLDYVSALTQEDAKDSLEICDEALELISANRSQIGAYTNRLEHTVRNLDNVAENTQEAESRIRDADMAEEMVKFSRDNILAQAGEAMLSQANRNQQQILTLLQ